MKKLGKKGCEGWLFQVIKEVDVIEEEHLLIHETTNVMKYNSAPNGYKVKHSVDISNIYLNH